MRRSTTQWIVAVAAGCVAGAACAAAVQSDRLAPPALAKRAAVAHARLPLAFEPVDGAGERDARYAARVPGYAVLLAANEAVVHRAGAADGAVRMRLLGASPRPAGAGIDRLPGTSNYFIGSDPRQWRRDVPNYAKVEYRGVYPGVDVVWYGNGRQLEYDFVVGPRADPRRIALAFDGVSGASIDAEGNLVLATPTGRLVQQRPVAYQEIDGLRHPVDARYVLRGKRQAGFVVAQYDRARPLVIDPVLVYATHLGGPNDDFSGRTAVDAQGNTYLVGATRGGFPTTAGALQTTYGGDTADFHVSKLDPTGTVRLYSTYLGGSGRESGGSIAVDTEGNAYITGSARTGFPTTDGAYQRVYGGDTDIVVAKLNAAGSALVYATYVGGGKIDVGNAIAIDGLGSAYVAGYSLGEFPTTPGAFQTTYAGGGADAVIFKLNPAGSALVYATYLGGTAADNSEAIAVDGAGEAVVMGYARDGTFPTTPGAYQRVYGGGDGDVFATRLNAAGSALVWSTLIGGSGEEYADRVVLDAGGNVHFVGETTGDFPTTPGAYQADYGGGPDDAIVAKLNAAGTALVYSTYFGGEGDDYGDDLAVDGAGNAIVVGFTTGALPTTAAALQPAYRGGPDDGFLAMFDAAGGALRYSTYLGTDGDDYATGVALDATGYVHVLGDAGAPGFPTTPGVVQPDYAGGASDTFVAKFGELAVPFSFQGLWWNFPAGSESGWGINFAHQGSIVFATWFTYGPDGKPLWLAAVLNRSGAGVYTGDVFTTTGPAFSAQPWDQSTVVETVVGTMTVTFRDANNATFAYTVNGVSQSKPITRQVFAQPVPTCVFDAQSDLSTATNFQDLWWKFVAGTESGWGVNFTHQGDIIFFTWFTYDASGKPLWLIAVAEKKSAGVYEGPISTVTGPPFSAVPWDPAGVVETVVGATTITFADGNRASFTYTVDGITQTKEITRQVFSRQGTVCQ